MRRTIIVALALIAAGCARPSAEEMTSDISFVQGCWVGRDVDDGSLLMSVRLSPSAAEDGAFTGAVFEPNATSGGANSFTFTPDGSALIVQNPQSFGARTPLRIPRSQPPPSSLVPRSDEISRQVAAFGDGEASGWIVVVVFRRENDDNLAIYYVHPNDDPGEMYFAGARESCP